MILAQMFFTEAKWFLVQEMRVNSLVYFGFELIFFNCYCCSLKCWSKFSPMQNGQIWFSAISSLLKIHQAFIISIFACYFTSFFRGRNTFHVRMTARTEVQNKIPKYEPYSKTEWCQWWSDVCKPKFHFTRVVLAQPKTPSTCIRPLLLWKWMQFTHCPGLLILYLCSMSS